MKTIFKIILLSLVITSCSNSDGDINPNGLLLRKVISDGVEILVSYNGNRIERITSNDGLDETKFYYTGDLITKIEVYYGAILATLKRYQYDGQGNPVNFIDYNYNTKTSEKVILAYNLDGTLTYNLYKGNLVSQNNISSRQSNATITNGEITSLNEVDNTYSWSPSDKTYKLTYDNKNTPFKNILGYEKILLIDRNFSENGINHNNVKEITIDNLSGESYTSMTADIQYNSNNFPINIEYTYKYAYNDTSISTYNLQFFYE
jgi:hypothetical protein